MDILQIFLNLISDGIKDAALAPIINLLKNNDFDLQKTLRSLDPQTLAPIIKKFMQENETPRRNGRGEYFRLAPIAHIADKDIIYTLNSYFG